MYAIRSYYESLIHDELAEAARVLNAFMGQAENLQKIEQAARLIADSFRITSYNVCYTKLLRISG